MKKILTTVLALALLSTTALFAKQIDKSISGMEFIKQLGFGWNLGNTLDAISTSDLSSEKSWGQPATTKAMIDGLAAAGIKTIRIPVSWHNHILNTTAYTIDPQWMQRVKTIVDWAIEDDMYVILNIHHDNAETPKGKMKPGAGYYPNSTNKEESLKFLLRIWAQICTTFNNNYDEHLIFETLNEPRLIGHQHEWNYAPNCKECKDSMNVLMEFNQKIVDQIRKTSGNNAFRFIAVPSLACGLDSLIDSSFQTPKDPCNRIIAAVHMYTPYDFAMNPSPAINVFTEAHKKNLIECFTKLENKFLAKKIPVYIGEMGATNKENLQDREKWFEFFVTEAWKKHIPSILWDNGAYDASDKQYGEKYGFYCRYQQKWYFPSLIKIAVESAGGTSGSIPLYDANYEYDFDSTNAEQIVSNFDTLSWKNSITIPKSKLNDLKKGSIIKIQTKSSESPDKTYRSLSFRNTKWKELKPFNGDVYGNGSIFNCSVNPNSDNAVYYWELSASDAEILKAQDILLCGNNVNVIGLWIQF